jgi:hypothetical protein
MSSDRLQYPHCRSSLTHAIHLGLQTRTHAFGIIVLAEYIRHHVKEGQNEMFAKIRQTNLDLEELGARLRQRKAELAGTAKDRPAPPGAAANA